MSESIVTYRISSRAYLERARARLADGQAEALFYAAFELRCGVEARMQEYLDARSDITRKVKHGYQIAKLAKGLDRAFALGERVISLSLVAEGRPTRHLLFTPVRAGLRKYAQRLGDYMHAMQRFREPDDPYWASFRDLLATTAAELGAATTGTLLGPPLVERATGKMSIVIEGAPAGLTGAEVARIGEKGVIGIRYWKTIPGSDVLDELSGKGDFEK